MRVAVVALALAVAVVAPTQADRGGKAGWPQEGSTLTYDLRAAGGAPDGSFLQATASRLVLRLADGAWTGSCTGTTTTQTDGDATTQGFERPSPLAPPSMPTRVHQGDMVDPDLTSAAAPGCRHDVGPVVVAKGAKGGSLHAAEDDAASAYQDVQVAWDKRSGLVQAWSFAGRSGGFEGRLVAPA